MNAEPAPTTPHPPPDLEPRLERVLDTLFRCTVALCRTELGSGRHDPLVLEVITDLDAAIRDLRCLLAACSESDAGEDGAGTAVSGDGR